MKVLLINPFGSNWIEGHEDNTKTAVRMAPIGILSIAAYLMERGVDVSVHSASASSKLGGEAEVMDVVRRHRPDMVGFTATTSGFLDAYRHAVSIKAAYPETKIVFGGVHVSALGTRILESYPEIDYLVTGEGEQAMAGLVAGAPLSGIQGVIFRNATGEAKSGPPRVDMCDLDSLPFPAYHKLAGFPQEFAAPLFNYPRAPSATIISSRGCPYQCSYCDRSVFKKSFRFNTAQYLYEHMAFLKRDFGIRHIFFYDDLFTFNRMRVEEFCDLLMKKPLGMTFNCAVRLGHIDDALLRMLKASGCWMVSLGIESGDPQILALHKAKVDLGEMKNAVRQVQKNGLRAKGLFMMGLPEENEASIKKTAEFISELNLDDMNMTKFTPFPGSPIYKDIHDKGTFIEDWELMNCLNFVFVPRGIESKERIEQLYNEFMRKFYTSPNWARKFVPLLFKSPDSAFRILRNMPTYMKMRKDFDR